MPRVILLRNRARPKSSGFKKGTPSVPPRLIEYAYYLSLFYSIMSVPLGISVGLFGGGLLAALAAHCIIRQGSRVMEVLTSIALPLGCAFSFIGIQLTWHDESLQSVRPWLNWVLLLIILQSLSMRQRFLHRFAVIAFVFGLATLPYLGIRGNPQADQVERMGIDVGVGFANPNDLAAWFGFCAVYFVISGLEATRSWTRVLSWLAATGSLYIVGLTVSRGILLAIATALAVAFRRLLKRGFLPLLSLILFVGLGLSSGLFDRMIDSYMNRATEETGRLSVWPLAINRFLNSPLTGVGISNSATYVPGSVSITPHNSFVGIGLISGVIPLFFFFGYWFLAARGAIRSNLGKNADATFITSLLIYCFIVSMSLESPFMNPWVVVTLCLATGVGPRSRENRSPVRRIRMVETVEHATDYGEGRHAVARYHHRRRLIGS